MAEDWDAATYDRIADPQTSWGLVVLDRLPLHGDERVLDAGCGTGRVTEYLLRRLPRGSVVALDGSAAMLAEARRRLASADPAALATGRVELVQADLGRPLPLEAPVDAILSTATFHWVLDHDALFANLAGALRPGGALVAQCGGAGNVASVLDAAAALGRPTEAVNFATAADTVRRLEASGFRDVWAWLQPDPAPFDSAAALETFLATVVLRTNLEGMAQVDRAELVHRVAARLPSLDVDYVRLNILARRR